MRIQAIAPWGTHTRWLTVFHLDPEELEVTPADIVHALEKENIETRPVWRPMHTQPLFASAEIIGGEVAEQLYSRGICLPSSSSLSEASQQRVIDHMTSLFRSHVAK
jgi:dTDP-4-amino-4,6-dideoxygalactose transaminase